MEMDRYKGNQISIYVYISCNKRIQMTGSISEAFRNNPFKQQLHNSFPFENINYVTKLLMKNQ